MKRPLKFLLIPVLFFSLLAFSQVSMKKDVIQFANYQHQETFPEFPGGINELMKFVSKNRIYENKQDKNRNIGTVKVKFTIMNDGSIGDSIIVTNSISEYYDREAVRIVKLMPKWTPGSIDGKPVNVLYHLPVKF